jgi:hypothetical protein
MIRFAHVQPLDGYRWAPEESDSPGRVHERQSSEV